MKQQQNPHLATLQIIKPIDFILCKDNKPFFNGLGYSRIGFGFCLKSDFSLHSCICRSSCSCKDYHICPAEYFRIVRDKDSYIVIRELSFSSGCQFKRAIKVFITYYANSEMHQQKMKRKEPDEGSLNCSITKMSKSINNGSIDKEKKYDRQLR